MQTISGSAVILDPLGLHVRPAGLIVKLVKESGVEVRLGVAGGELVLASAPLRLMSLRAAQGVLLRIEIDTEDIALANSLIADIQKILQG
jgi:phosphocarrier protein HPr